MTRLKSLVWKDLVEEFRTRYAFNTLLMFALTTLVMVSFAAGVYALTPGLHAAFIWIIIFFSAMSGIARTFVKEEERGTAQALRLSAPPGLIFTGKFLFNFMLIGILAVLILPLYHVMMAPPPHGTGMVLAVLFLGVLALSGATTTLAAIVARAGGRNALLPILSFPVLLPILVAAINATAAAMGGGEWSDVQGEIQFLLSYSVVIITASMLLFGYVWND